MTLRLDLDGTVRDRVGAVDTSALIPELDQQKRRLMKEAYRLGGIDPVTGELVRFRNARLQDCHVCQAFRDPNARDHGATEEKLAAVDDYESSDLSEDQKVALRFADAYLTAPAEVSDELRASMRRDYTPVQIVELVLRLSATTSNRVLRTLGLDAD